MVDTLKFLNYSNYSLDTLSSSYRFFDLILLAAIMLLSFISILLISHRLKIHLEDLFLFFDKYWRILTRQKIDPRFLFHGGVVGSNLQIPIHAASVVLLSPDTGKIRSQGITNFLGEFHLKVEPGKVYTLIIKRKGFHSLKRPVSPNEISSNQEVYQLEEEAIFAQGKIINFILVIFTPLLHLFSDVLFFLSIIFGFFLFLRLGIPKSLPLILITLFNILLWMELVWGNWQEAKIKRRQ